MIFKIVPNSMKTLWGFQRFRKSEGPCMCWSRRAIGPQMLFPASPPARHIVQCLASVERPSTLDHQGNWRVRLWVIYSCSCRLPWVGFSFSLLISTSTLWLKKPSLCLSMFIFSNSSGDESGKGQAWSVWIQGSGDSLCLPNRLHNPGASGLWVISGAAPKHLYAGYIGESWGRLGCPREPGGAQSAHTLPSQPPPEG